VQNPSWATPNILPLQSAVAAGRKSLSYDYVSRRTPPVNFTR
jgi:hypothetical protein